MLLQSNETDDGTRNGTRPDENKEAPAPITLFTQCRQCQRGIRARDMPVDGSMVPLTQPLLPFRMVLHRVIEGRSHIRAEHAEEIEDDPYPRPVAVATEDPHEKDHAENHSQRDASAMRRGVPDLLFPRVPYHNGCKVTHFAEKSLRISEKLTTFAATKKKND